MILLQASSTSSLTHKLASLGLGRDKDHKRTFSLPGRGHNNKEKMKEKQDKHNKDNTINGSESGESVLSKYHSLVYRNGNAAETGICW